MLSKYMFDVARVVEGAVEGDMEKVLSYCEQLEKHLEDDNEKEAAELIREIVAERATVMELAHTSSQHDPIPCDDDSSLPIADREVFKSIVPVILPEKTKASIDEFVLSYESLDRLRASGVSVSPSLLTYGPPGCGKTQLARHLSSRVGLPLITARTDALISSYLGSTAKNIRSLFDYTAERPCVLFLDEFDAIAKMRDDQHELGELKRVVISLLQNIDSLGGKHLLLAATNHPHLLDPAIWRRFSYKIELSEPDQDCRFMMLSDFFKGRISQESLITIAAISEGLTGSELRDIAELSIRRAVLSDSDQVNIRGVLENVVDLLADQSVPTDTPSLIRFLYESGKFTQQELGDLFGKSQSYVSKHVTKDRSHAEN